MPSRNHTLRILLIALLFGLAYWLIDAVYELFYFESNFTHLLTSEPLTLMDSLILHVPPHALFNRFIFILACLVGGLLIARYMRRIRKSEYALRRSEQRFRGIFDHTLNAIVIFDVKRDEEGRIVRCEANTANPNLEKHTGLKREELIGREVTELLDERDRKLILESFNHVLEKHDGITLEGLSTSFDRFLNMMIFPLGSDQVVMMIQDITEQRKALEEQRRIEAQMQHAQKMESLGVMAGGIAHDFNNLLMAIMGNADMVAEDLPLDSSVRRNVLEIESASRRAADLCNQMLAYSGKGNFVIKAVNLNKIVKEISGLLSVSISKKVHLRINPTHSLSDIQADATQIRQVIMNLVTNASEAIGDEEGEIIITTRQQYYGDGTLLNQYTQEALPAGEYVSTEIADNGTGMDAATVEKIFEPFFTTKFTGRGLGLAAVQGIVRGHKGTIHIETAPGQGTKFTVYFPVAVSKEITEQKEKKKSREAWNKEGTVLLVDDERSVREIGARLIKRLGFHCQTASDGREAVDLIKEHPDAFACVVLDLLMPRMDGEEAFKEIQHINPVLPVIISSGYSQQEYDNRFWQVHPSGFLQKPYRRDALELELRRALED
jgi:two-component system, cell cycle sensor histidine kinase and response regulator CckA